jgi:hypothetical protein
MEIAVLRFPAFKYRQKKKVGFLFLNDIWGERRRKR